MTAGEDGDGADALARLGVSNEERAVLREFVNSWKDHGGPVLFVGAGMSRFESERKPGVPDTVEIAGWSGLTEGLRAAATGGDPALDGALPHDGPGVAQHYGDRHGRRLLIDNLQRAIPYREFNPGAAHRALRGIAWCAIVTTNYDDFLERTFETARKIVIDEDLTRGFQAGALCIVKMHGCFDVHDSIVISSADYESYEQSRGAVLGKVRVLLLEHPTLFLGCSLTDPNVLNRLAWVRTRANGYELPSVALVHDSPSDDRRKEWADKSIHLVQRPHGRTVAQFLEALVETAQGTARPAEDDRRAARRELVKTLRVRADGWLERAVALVADIALSGTERDRSDAAHDVLYGTLHGLTTEEIRAILERLDPAERRAILLAGARTGIIVAKGKRGEAISVEGMLLDDAALATADRAEVLVLRAERALTGGTPAAVAPALKEAVQLAEQIPWKGVVHDRLRRALLRRGNAREIRRLATAPATGGDAFAHAKRGADLLILGERDAARQWYEQARGLASSGDEKTAALLGLIACLEPDCWEESSKLDAERRAARGNDAPRLQEIHDLEDKAASALLRAVRNGKSGDGGGALEAAQHLEVALKNADDMGWPRSIFSNVTGPADSLAYSAVGASIRAGAPRDERRRGLELFVERGLLQAHRRLPRSILDEVLVLPEVSAWTRPFLAPRRGEAFSLRRSRSLLASAFLPALSDDEIDEHVRRVLRVGHVRTVNLGTTSDSELHVELLQAHYTAMPRVAALETTKLVTRAFADESMARHLRSGWTALPIWDWIKTGVMRGRDDDLDALVKALVEFVSRGGQLESFSLRAALGLLEELHSAGAIRRAQRLALLRAMDRRLADALQAGEEAYQILALVRVRHDLQPAVPADDVVTKFVAMYRRLKNSTAADTWVNAIDVVGPHLALEQRKVVATCIRDYVEFTIDRVERSVIGPFPEWAATAIHQGVRSGVLSRADGRRLFQELMAAYPETAPFVLGVEGLDVGAAERTLLVGVAHGRTDIDALLRWCGWLPAGSAPSLPLERILLGQLASSEPRSRQRAYWALGWLARNRALSEHGARSLREAVLDLGVGDPAWRPRAAAIVAAAGLGKALGQDGALAIVRLAEHDPVAGVRRAGGFFCRARRRGWERRRG